MVGRIPSAIVRAANSIVINVPSAEFSGISNPKYQGAFGYHHSRDHLAIYNPGDPSMKHPLDKLGASDACSALDIKLSPSMMRLVTKRLIDACRRDDPFARGIAEVGGTLNGTSTIAWDEKDQRLEYGWDSTHLWHIHVSGWRKYADDEAAWMDIARLFAGQTGEEDDMDGNTYIKGSAEVKLPSGTGDFSSFNKPFGWWLSAMYAHILASENVVKTVAAGVASIDALDDEAKAAIDAANAELANIRKLLDEPEEPPPPDPWAGPPLLGIDVSLHRGDIDWPAVAAVTWTHVEPTGVEGEFVTTERYRVQFATLKASHGLPGTQAGLEEHWAREAPEMAASGIPLVGGAHRLIAGVDPAGQVDAFQAAMWLIGGHQGRLVLLDAEMGDPATILEWMAEWNRRTGGYPVLGYVPDWKEVQWTGNEMSSFGFAGWWASEYVPGEGNPVDLIHAITDEHWHSHDGIAPTILQFSSRAVVPGVNPPTDVNLFRGTLAELRELATRPGDG